MTGDKSRATTWVADHKHHTTDRLLSEDDLESLLAWWRSTAKDRAGNPLFCIHHNHTGACLQCPPPLPSRCDRGMTDSRFETVATLIAVVMIVAAYIATRIIP